MVRHAGAFRCVRAAVLSFGVLLFLGVGAAAGAQAYWQPRPAPLVTAENETWFQLGEPITFEGYVYYPAGARVYFDGNVMVRSGAFRGIPLYTDTTIEAYSRVFIPVTGGLLQPYERRRTGDAAGTTGSRAPSFPVTMAGEPSDEAEFVGAVGTVGAASGPRPGPGIPGDRNGTPALSSPSRDVVEAGLKPKGLNEIYVNYSGSRWRAAGKAVPMSDSRFEEIGRSNGFPIYAARGDTDPRVIYVPSRAGLVAPYERAGTPPKY